MPKEEGHPEKLVRTLDELIIVVRRLNRTQTLWYAFWHGLMIGIGSTVGIALVVSGLLAILGRLDYIPSIHEFRNTVLPYLQRGH